MESKSKKIANNVLVILVIIAAIGFVAGITVLILERIQFSQTLTKIASSRDAKKTFENLGTLLEAYNKSNTTEILALLYTVLTTIAFSYGFIVFQKVQEAFEQIKNTKRDIENQAFFSRMMEKFNFLLCLLIGKSALPAGEDKRLYILRDYFEECEENFQIGEIKRRGKISSLYKTDLINILKTIKSMLEQFLLAISDSTEPIKLNEKKVIKICISICDRYLDVIENLKVEDKPD